MLQCNKYRYLKRKENHMPIVLAMATAEIVAAGILIAAAAIRTIFVIRENRFN